MNIGKDNRHPKYICDKCGNEIYYLPQKGFKNLHKYYKQRPTSEQPKRSFDLCNNCEEKFRDWLKEKDIPTMKETISQFPVWEE